MTMRCLCGIDFASEPVPPHVCRIEADDALKLCALAIRLFVERMDRGDTPHDSMAIALGAIAVKLGKDRT